MGILFTANDQPLTVFASKVDTGPAHVREVLSQHGIRSIITADIRYADYHASSDCRFQQGGDCRCHEAVLLVYGEAGPPLTLILQCRGNWTCVYISTASVTRENAMTKLRLEQVMTSEDNGAYSQE